MTVTKLCAIQTHMDTAKYIKDTRKQFGMTQEQFANLFNIKRYNLAKYETGRSMPPGTLILNIMMCDIGTKVKKKDKAA